MPNYRIKLYSFFQNSFPVWQEEKTSFTRYIA